MSAPLARISKEHLELLEELRDRYGLKKTTDASRLLTKWVRENAVIEDFSLRSITEKKPGFKLRI